MKRRTNPKPVTKPEAPKQTDPLAMGPPIRLVPPEPPALVQEWRIQLTPGRTFRVRRSELGFFQTLILGLSFPVDRVENGKTVRRFSNL